MTLQALDRDRLRSLLDQHNLADWWSALSVALDSVKAHGRDAEWQQALAGLPEPSTRAFSVDEGVARVGASADEAGLRRALRALKPWRKGPFQFGSLVLDAEWRCDLKWQRLAPHIDLAGQRVLDIGCGNGYYLLRALDDGAALAVGVDPSWLFVFQFEALLRHAPPLPALLLPLGIEQLPRAPADGFDRVLSMGVLYHRRDPLDHLQHLLAVCATDGEVILETLILPGDRDEEIQPGRYAGMPNVHRLPSLSRLRRWLDEAGAGSMELLDVSATTSDEQRVTEWSGPVSLADRLREDDPSTTIEGWPAPLRAMLRVQR